jgi:hypothetical protein
VRDLDSVGDADATRRARDDFYVRTGKKVPIAFVMLSARARPADTHLLA